MSNNINVLNDEEAELQHHSIVWVVYDENGEVFMLSNKEFLGKATYQAKLRCYTSEFESTLLKWSSQCLRLCDTVYGGFSVMEARRVKLISQELAKKIADVVATSEARPLGIRYTLNEEAMANFKEELGA
jgi:hypothetical protein